MDAPFWSARAAVFLAIAGVGTPRLVMLLRTDARPAAIAGLVFIGWAAISTDLSTDRGMALLGRYGQGTGLLFIIAIVAAWALGCSLPASGRHLVEQAVLAGAVVNAAVAVLQTVFDLSSLHLQDFGRRAAGLLGNAVHLGAIAAAALALVAPRLLGRGRLGVAWAAAGVLLATAVQLSGSRSGLVVTIGLLLWALVALGWRTAAVLTSEMFPRGRRKWGEISKIGEMSRDFPGLRLSSPGLLFSSGGSARRGTRRSGRRWRPSRSRKRANCERSHPLRARTPTP